mgnify:CR=1 FL=1|jgi:hypothetical protein|tara:strand:+ start:2557 stop:3150 length:594 start_codon:yes stop_codon:yes gene_type:complete
MVLENKQNNDTIKTEGLNRHDLDALESLNEDDSPQEKPSQESGASLNTQTAQTKLKNEALEEKFNPGLTPAKVEIPRKVGSKSWRPAALTHVKGRDPKYSYRFFDSSRPGRLDKAQAEGWEVVKNNDSAELPIRSMSDGAATDSVKRVRELVLMRIPKEMAKQRAKFFQNLESTPEKLKEQFADQTATETYGDIKIS